MQSLSLYGCVDSTSVVQLLQGRMERRNYVDVIRCRKNEKGSTSCGKYRWCQSILQYSLWTDAFVDFVVSPRYFMNFCSMSLGRGFVSISAILSDVGVY